MLGGIKTLLDGDYCMYCNTKIKSENYDFCPKCGNPLTENAIKLREQQDRKIKLEVYDHLSEIIKDKSDLEILCNELKNI